MEVEDCMSSGGEDYYCSDRDSLDDALENEDSDSQWAPPKGSSSKVITKESLLAAQREDLRRVMELLSLREHHARTLLIHYRWDVEKIFAVLVEKGKIRLFTEAGLPMLESHVPDSSVSTSTMMCDICMEDLPSSEKTKMDCGHCFCNNCKRSLRVHLACRTGWYKNLLSHVWHDIRLGQDKTRPEWDKNTFFLYDSSRWIKNREM